MTLKDIFKFERLNTMSINVYDIENGQVLPLRLTDDKKEKSISYTYKIHAIHSLGHFAWIKNIVFVMLVSLCLESSCNAKAAYNNNDSLCCNVLLLLGRI